jgi:hypothetical protein
MAATANANPPMTAEAKGSRKKKVKAVTEGAPSTPDKERSGSIAGTDADVKAEAGQENAYIKDLQK